MTASGVSIKLVSLNVERSKHLDLVENFFVSEMPDVVCLQELMQEDIPRLLTPLGNPIYVFEPMALRPDEPPSVTMGIGVFSRFPIVEKSVRYYVGEPGVLRDSMQNDPSTYNNLNRIVLAADIQKDGRVFRIATTHLTWTPDGESNDEQRRDAAALLRVLEEFDEFVLCGDFNAPRGGEIFSMFASRYKDNIPPHYTSSLDPELHRAGPLELMVDGIFSTPSYAVSGVELISGVSDHKALVATVSKTLD